MKITEAIAESFGIYKDLPTVDAMIQSYTTAIEGTKDRMKVGKAYVIDTLDDGTVVTSEEGFLQIWPEIVESLKTDGKVALKLLAGQRDTYAIRLAVLRSGRKLSTSDFPGGKIKTTSDYIESIQDNDREVRAVAKHFHLKYPEILPDRIPPQNLLTSSMIWAMRTLAIGGGTIVGYATASRFVPLEQVVALSPYAIGFVATLLAPAFFTARHYWNKARSFDTRDQSLNASPIK